MIFTKEINVDIKKLNIDSSIRFHEGDIDGSVLRVNVYDNGSSFDLTQYTVKYDASIADYLAEQDAEATKDNNAIVVPITERMTAKDGTLRIDVKLIKDNSVAFIPTLEMFVQNRVINENTMIDVSDTTIAQRFAALEAKFPVQTSDIAPGVIPDISGKEDLILTTVPAITGGTAPDTGSSAFAGLPIGQAFYCVIQGSERLFIKKSSSVAYPVLPSGVSAFANDAGYLTQHQDISDLMSLAVTVTTDDTTDVPMGQVFKFNDDYYIKSSLATPVGAQMQIADADALSDCVKYVDGYPIYPAEFDKNTIYNVSDVYYGGGAKLFHINVSDTLQAQCAIGQSFILLRKREKINGSWGPWSDFAAPYVTLDDSGIFRRWYSNYPSLYDDPQFQNVTLYPYRDICVQQYNNTIAYWIFYERVGGTAYWTQLPSMREVNDKMARATPTNVNAYRWFTNGQIFRITDTSASDPVGLYIKTGGAGSYDRDRIALYDEKPDFIRTTVPADSGNTGPDLTDSSFTALAVGQPFYCVVAGSQLLFIKTAADGAYCVAPVKTSQLTNDSGFLTAHQDISGKENVSNKVTSLSSSSTDAQYPSAKCVYDLIGDIESALDALL